MPVIMTIGSQLTLSGLPDRAIWPLTQAATFRNPLFTKKTRLNLWTGNTPEILTLWQQEDQGRVLILPRGMICTVIAVCNRFNLVLKTHDETVYPPLLAPLTLGRLYDYQRTALDQLVTNWTGFLSAPTGSGKTNILLSAIARLKTPTIILTHTTGLLQQTAQRCRDWLCVDPGLIGAGKWDVKPITVAMIQTLTRRPEAKELRDLFGCVIADECHHMPSVTMGSAMNLFRARYKYGVTATAWRKDHLEQMMWLTLGPIVATISQKDVVDHGSVIKPNFEVVNTPFEFDLQDPKDWTKMITALVENENRNTLVAGVTAAFATAGARVLVLTDRIDHAHRLAYVLECGTLTGDVPRVDLQPVVLTGDQSKKDLRPKFDAVRAGVPITIATAALMGEGIDVPGWDVLVLASPFAGGPKTLQAVGRVCRAAKDKTSATVIDICDPLVPALVNARYARQAALRKGGVL